MNDTTFPPGEPIHITLDRAVDLLREAVAERGENYVYEYPENAMGSCVYVVTDYGDNDELIPVAPSCIVGTAMHKAGVPLDFMAQSAINSSSSQSLREELMREAVADWDEGAALLFQWAQKYQDDSNPWGDSLRMAIDRLKELGTLPADFELSFELSESLHG